MTDRMCAVHECSLPLVQRPGEETRKFLARETCGGSCGTKLARHRSKLKPRVMRPKIHIPHVRWPTVTGETDWNGAFGAQNVKTNDGGHFYPPHVPATQSYIGSSAAMLVRSTGE